MGAAVVMVLSKRYSKRCSKNSLTKMETSLIANETNSTANKTNLIANETDSKENKSNLIENGSNSVENRSNPIEDESRLFFNSAFLSAPKLPKV